MQSTREMDWTGVQTQLWVALGVPAKRIVMRVAFALSLAASLGACATTPGGVAGAERDPLEKTNRAVYSFNKGIDTALFKPTAKVYRAVVPGAARRGASNALDNVDEPLSFINALLQGKIKSAFRAVDRFLINTTLGVGGLADHATDMGLPKQEEDFGQTLATWGVGSGPFIMLPFFGPSTLRDTVGLGVDTVTDPWPYFQKEAVGLSGTERLAVTGFEVVDLRSRLIDTADPLLEGALDEYATVRAAYLQQRLTDIYDGDPPEELLDPGMPAEPAEPPAESTEATGAATPR
jgi:phospholipid-binding lipoprotein MlaA